MSKIKNCSTCQNNVLSKTDKTAQQKCDICKTVECCGINVQNPTQYEAFEFNVGDYVETTDGYVGYIRKVNMETEGFFKGYCHIYATLVDRGNLECSCYDTELVNYFKRIGKYDFTKQPEATKIEKLSYPSDWIEMRDKINEVIDKINEIGGRK